MIGERIRTYRQSKGIKVADFAKLIGVSQGSLSDIENQKTKPSAETISALVRHTDIDARWLMTGEGEMRQLPIMVADKPEGWQVPIRLDADRRHAVLQNKLQRILDEGDKTKVDAVKGMLKAFDPGEKKQDVDCSENEGAGTARNRAA